MLKVTQKYRDTKYQKHKPITK